MAAGGLSHRESCPNKDEGKVERAAIEFFKGHRHLIEARARQLCDDLDENEVEKMVLKERAYFREVPVDWLALNDVSNELKKATARPVREMNAERLIESEENAKRKAERKKMKKKLQREKKKAANEARSARSNESTQDSVNSFGSCVESVSARAETDDDSSARSDHEDDGSDRSDDEILDLDSAFLKAAVKQSKILSTLKKPPISGTKKDESISVNKTVQPESDKVSPETAYSLRMEARQHVSNNEFYRAIDCLTKAISMHRMFLHHYYSRSYCYLRIGQYELALKDALFIKEHAQVLEHIAGAVARAGQAYVGLRNYHAAEKCFEECLSYGRRDKWIVRELWLVRVVLLTNMGFSKKRSLTALQRCSTVNNAVDQLISEETNDAHSEPVTNNPSVVDYKSNDIYMSDDESTNTNLVSELAQRTQDEYNSSENCQNTTNTPESEDTSGFQQAIRHSTKKISTTTTTNTPQLQNQQIIYQNANNIWVGNVTAKMDGEKLRTAFSKFGSIQSVKTVPEKRYAFVNFKSKASAVQALKCQPPGIFLDGIQLLIKPALPVVENYKKWPIG